MADPTMLSLFENENGMIDDLGAITENGFPPSQHSIAGRMPTNGSGSNSASSGSTALHGSVHPHMTSQADPMLGPMQPQTFSHIAASQLHHQNASTPQPTGSHSQKFHPFDEFDQFPAQKLHYIGSSSQTQDPGLISHFGQPSQHSGRIDGPFSQYPMQGISGLQQEQQQQSVEMTQPSMWPSQQSTTPHGTPSYISDHIPSYLTHHDYAL